MTPFTYTSRTNPFLEVIHQHFPQTYIVNKPTEAIRAIEQRLLANPPHTIIGIFHSWDKRSYIEPLAINQFNRTKRVLPSGPTSYPLTIPATHPGFTRNPQPSDSFCNWMMYRITHLIHQHQLPSQHLFFHCHATDVPLITNLIETVP